jgi:hypothetical protein
MKRNEIRHNQDEQMNRMEAQLADLKKLLIQNNKKAPFIREL